MTDARTLRAVVCATAGAVGALGAGVASGATTPAGMQAVGHGHAVDAGFGADRMTLSVRPDGTRHLTFSRLSPRVELMGVAPAADRTSATMENWALAWKRLYGRTEPNVIVTYGKGGHRTRESYTLARARYYRAKGTMDFTLRPMATGARGRPALARPGTRRVKATRRQLGPGTVFVQQAGRSRARPGVDVSHSAGRITLRTTPGGVQHLVLRAYAPSAEMTGVAPSHDRVAVPTALWARNFSRLYRKVKPNAILSYGRGAGAQRASVVLNSLRFNPAKGTIDFAVKPLGHSPLPWVAPGASASLGSGVLFVDQTVDFGSQTAVQTQATLNALVAMGFADDVSNDIYSCCAVGSSPANVQNEMQSGMAYDGLTTAPGYSGVIEFSGAPAFGTAQFATGQTITFANGMDVDGATFGLTGPGAFKAGGATINFGEVAPGTPAGTGGTNGLVIFNGDFTNSTITGALGGDSALIGGSMSGSTIDGLQVNSAVLDNVSFTGAKFTSAPTEFNDSALVGVTFAGAEIGTSPLGFYGSSLEAAEVPSPSGASTLEPTSFAGLSGGSFDFGASQDPDEADAWPLMSQVDFSGSSWSEFSVSDTVMQGNNFTGASLGSRPSFTSVSIDNASSFDQVDFGSPTFTSCSFNGTDLTSVGWTSPEFAGTAESPTVLKGVTFSSESFKAGGSYSATFENVTFNGTTFVGLSPANAEDVAFVSGLMKAPGVTTEGLGLIAFNTQYVQGRSAEGEPAWYQVNSTGTEWTPIDSTTLEPTGPPTDVDPVPEPEPEPEP